jgi:crotonobetaine/carnitine-CoA ligase
LEDILVNSNPKLIVVDGRLLPRLAEVIERVPCEHVLLHAPEGETAPGWTKPMSGLFTFPEKDLDLSAIEYGDVSAVLWTSGTTGKSKGVMQSHNVWIRNAEAGEDYATRPGDGIYSVLPMYNSAAWSANIFRALVDGLPCALDQRFSVSTFWDRVRFYGSTQTFTLGAMHMFLWRAPARPDDRDNPLRVAGMVPMPDQLIGPFCERFGMERILQGFGQSETFGVLHRGLRLGRTWKAGSLGVPCDDVDVKLVDDRDHEVPAGVPGEFCIKPKKPHTLFEGYFNDPEATRAAFVGEWFKTGDLGRRDEDGEFFFVDRKKDAVRFAGRNISTLEVEAAVRKHQAVADVAAFGVRSQELESEQELKINVILRSGASLTPEELARFINDSAPYYFVPRYIEFVDSLPYTPTSKVQKFLLREQGVTKATWDRKASKFVVTR